jgi:hypothetical protein
MIKRHTDAEIAEFEDSRIAFSGKLPAGGKVLLMAVR